MKEIQEKYKGQPERLQQEMMRLYKEEGFNPFGGCLPMLIPMPVLFTLFFVFQATIEFRGTEFLWLPDLSRPDPYYIIPVLMALSMFVLQYLSYRSTPEPNPQLKMMMWFMPIFMLVVLLNFASGLNLYYASSNVARLPQQLYIMKERNKVHLRQAAKGKDEKR
jgi:YidC/Oxa1 family membrane protein insertase